MKRIILLASLVLLPVALSTSACDHDHATDDDCCDHHDDERVTRSFDLRDFDEIECRSAIRLTVRQSDTFRVEVTIAGGDRDDIEVKREGRRLRLELDGRVRGEVEAVVELPVLKVIEAEDASRVTLQGIGAPGDLQLRLRGASELKGDASAERTTIDLGQASSLELRGATGELRVKAGEASRARLRELASKRADLTLHGASQATINVSEWLDVEARALSVVHYYGDPRLGDIDLSGGARLEHEH